MGVKGGSGRRSTPSRKRRARTGAVFLAVAAAEGVLVGLFDLTGSTRRTATTPPHDAVPYYLTTERTPPRPEPKNLAAERRPPRTRKPAAAPAPGLPSPTTPAAPTSSAAAPPAPDYGRWTVAPGAWPEAGHGGIVMSVCDPTRLASLPPDARKACAQKLARASAAGPPARRGAAPDWKDHSALSCEPKNEPAHKLLLDHCSPVGGRGVGFTLKYKF